MTTQIMHDAHIYWRKVCNKPTGKIFKSPSMKVFCNLVGFKCDKALRFLKFDFV